MIQPIVLDPIADRDIIEWLGHQPNKSAAVREAVREKITRIQAQPALADILHEIRAIQRKLDQGIIQYPGGELDSEQGEPETAARNLDALDEILGEL